MCGNVFTVAGTKKLTSLLDDTDSKDFDGDKDARDYFSARNWLERNTPPVIHFTIDQGYDFSDDKNGDADAAKFNSCPLIPLTIKLTIASTEETHWSALNT